MWSKKHREKYIKLSLFYKKMLLYSHVQWVENKEQWVENNKQREGGEEGDEIQALSFMLCHLYKGKIKKTLIHLD